MARARLATHRRARVPSVVRDRRRDRCARAMRAAVRRGDARAALRRRPPAVRPPPLQIPRRPPTGQPRQTPQQPGRQCGERLRGGCGGPRCQSLSPKARPPPIRRPRRRAHYGNARAAGPVAGAAGRRGHWAPGARRWPPGDAAGRRRRAQFMSAMPMPMPMRVPPIAATPPRRHASAGWAARAAPSSDGAGGGAGRAGGEGRGRPSGRGVRGALKGSNPCPRHRARGRPPWRNPPP